MYTDGTTHLAGAPRMAGGGAGGAAGSNASDIDTRQQSPVMAAAPAEGRTPPPSARQRGPLTGGVATGGAAQALRGSMTAKAASMDLMNMALASIEH
jgi:hypothetical protein